MAAPSACTGGGGDPGQLLSRLPLRLCDFTHCCAEKLQATAKREALSGLRLAAVSEKGGGEKEEEKEEKEKETKPAF